MTINLQKLKIEIDQYMNQIFPPEIRNPYTIGFVFIIFIFIGYSIFSSKPEDPSNFEPTSMDTFIPHGHNLVNINVVNSESLDSIIGEKAVVDVYVPAPKGKAPKLLLRKARVLRAPLNPNHYALLVPEDWTSKILSHGSEFIISVSHPDAPGTKIVSDPKSHSKGVSFDVN